MFVVPLKASRYVQCISFQSWFAYHPPDIYSEDPALCSSSRSVLLDQALADPISSSWLPEYEESEEGGRSTSPMIFLGWQSCPRYWKSPTSVLLKRGVSLANLGGSYNKVKNTSVPYRGLVPW